MRLTKSVYQITQQIPLGKVATYGQIAVMVGKPGAARAVGQALHKNPYAPVVPCHRVAASSGHLHGFASGLVPKKKLLEQEGVKVWQNKVDLKKYLWESKGFIY